MIIAKEFIDASIDAKNAAKEAFNNAILEAIKNKMPELKQLPDIIKEIMDTYRYVKKRDEKASTSMWTAMCCESEKFDLDFFNALRITGITYCGVRPHFAKRGVRSNLCVTEIGIFFSGDSGLYTINELMDCTKPDQYESTSRAIFLLVDSVPKYRDCLADQLREILK